MPAYFKNLSPSDIDQLVELFLAKPLVFTKHTDVKFQEEFVALLKDEIQNPHCFFPSIFVDEKLYLSIYLKETIDAPSFIWAYELVRQGALSAILKPDFLDAAIKLEQAIYQEMIVKRNLNRIYFAYPYDENVSTRSVNSIERIHKYIKKSRNYESIISKFELFTDCIVRKDTLPKYKYQQKIIGERTWPFDIAIRIAMLKS